MSVVDIPDFIAYDLLDTGERRELDIGIEDVGEYLNPKAVFLFVRYDLRRIYIWKGSVSPVRKRFISSRVATQIQEEIKKKGGRQLKIVSIDQGDELKEFLDAFHLESMPVTETLEDLHYVRNVDRDREPAKIIDSGGPASAEGNVSANGGEAAATVTTGEVTRTSKETTTTASKKPPVRKVGHAPVSSTGPSTRPTATASPERVKAILKQMLDNPVPDGETRLNVVVGNALFGPTVQKKMVLGKEVETQKWERIEEVPGGCVDLELKHLRIYTDKETGTVTGLEILVPSKNKAPTADSSGEKATKPAAKKASRRPLKAIPKG